MNLIEVFRQKRRPRQEKNAPQTDGGAPQGETAAQLSADKASDPLSLLTKREYELFLLLLEGYTLKESAKQLSIKYSTANTHMTAIYKKLHVNSRAGLIINYHSTGREKE